MRWRRYKLITRPLAPSRNDEDLTIQPLMSIISHQARPWKGEKVSILYDAINQQVKIVGDVLKKDRGESESPNSWERRSRSTEIITVEPRASSLRPDNKKLEKLRSYPPPKSFEDLEQFYYFITYLKRFVPGKYDLLRILKEAAIWENNTTTARKNSKEQLKYDRRLVDFLWSGQQQQAFEKIIKCIIDTRCWGGDMKWQFHPHRNAVKLGAGLRDNKSSLFLLSPKLRRPKECELLVPI